ncbi:hypothetical protein, partial [Vibrio parahaemolyticus]|uniref:hypothetical protein n=1 Tax=Vibrio parahaemolyticus TaxID=670 RepID=UPI003B66D471
NNQSAKKTDDSSKRTIVRKTPSYQQSDDLEKQTIVQNVLSDSLKRTTSDTNLMKLSKDIKDIKHQTDFQNQ